MGANAQTSVPAFTAGQVLTAAQVTGINTGIPVFASSTERDAAFGGTGEKTLAEGQMAYLEDTDETQYYDGSSWAAVGGGDGLVFISRTTIGSAVSSVTVSGAFSSDYDNYRIIMTGGSPSSSTDMFLKLGATVTGYYAAGKLRFYAGTDGNKDDQNVTRWFIGTNGASNSMALDVMVLGPNLATETAYGSQARGMYTTGAAGFVGGFLDDTTQYTDFTIEPNVGTLTGGTIDVYGYAKA